MIKRDQWKWYGNVAHNCVGPWCRFHLATEIGSYLVSTVGEYFSPHKSEKECPEKPSEVGCGRLYETYVFRLKGRRCEAKDCGCGIHFPDYYKEIDSLAANDAKKATANHYELCEKYAHAR